MMTDIIKNDPGSSTAKTIQQDLARALLVGQDEEGVHSQEAAGQEARVMEQDAEDRDAADAVESRLIARRPHPHIPRRTTQVIHGRRSRPD